MLLDLNWENYLKLNNHIEEHPFKRDFFSPIALVSWRFYGINYKYHILSDDTILMYVSYQNEHQPNFWYVTTCFYKEDFDLELIKKLIHADCLELNKIPEIKFSDVSANMLEDWKLNQFEHHQTQYVTNYIYELEKMKTFAGKKLQKKRNHLNNFMNESYDYEIVDIRNVAADQIMVFVDEHMRKYSDKYRENEIAVYKQYLYHEIKKDPRYFGTVIYINKQIKAFTFCYARKLTCDVIIEKAERDINGLYQFLIKSNLTLHPLDVPYMDREDDAGEEALAQSKRSYYPIEMVVRYDVDEPKGW